MLTVHSISKCVYTKEQTYKICKAKTDISEREIDTCAIIGADVNPSLNS